MVKGFVSGPNEATNSRKTCKWQSSKVVDCHGEANCRERTVFLLCLIVTVSLAIDTVLCPVDVALAQVTIIPGTDDDDDNFEDDIEDGDDESEEIPE